MSQSCNSCLRTSGLQGSAAGRQIRAAIRAETDCKRGNLLKRPTWCQAVIRRLLVLVLVQWAGVPSWHFSQRGQGPGLHTDLLYGAQVLSGFGDGFLGFRVGLDPEARFGSEVRLGPSRLTWDQRCINKPTHEQSDPTAEKPKRLLQGWKRTLVLLSRAVLAVLTRPWR